MLAFDRHARHQVELLQEGEAHVVVRLEQVVAVGEVANAPHVWGLAVTLEDRLYAGIPQIGVRDDPMWKPDSVRCFLQTLGFRDRVGAADGGLHMYRLGDFGVPGPGDLVSLGESL